MTTAELQRLAEIIITCHWTLLAVVAYPKLDSSVFAMDVCL